MTEAVALCRWHRPRDSPGRALCASPLGTHLYSAGPIRLRRLRKPKSGRVALSQSLDVGPESKLTIWHQRGRARRTVTVLSLTTIASWLQYGRCRTPVKGLSHAGLSEPSLLLDLHGYDDQRVEPGQALDALLWTLGVSAVRIPPGAAERAALYRSVLAEIGQPALMDRYERKG